MKKFLSVFVIILCLANLRADDHDTTPPINYGKGKQKASRMMDELEGWCTKYKALVLMDLIYSCNAKKVVEIGVWGGKSLLPMAVALKTLGQGTAYGIDPWQKKASIAGQDNGANKNWWSNVNYDRIYQQLLSKISKFGLQKYVVLIKSSSQEAPIIKDIDVLHIDGNHSDEVSYSDVCKWAPQVKSGGYIIFDDVNWGTTYRAVNWLDQNCIPLNQYNESNLWRVWQKP